MVVKSSIFPLYKQQSLNLWNVESAETASSPSTASHVFDKITKNCSHHTLCTSQNRFIPLSNTAVQNINSVVGNGELAHKKVGIWRRRLRTPALCSHVYVMSKLWQLLIDCSAFAPVHSDVPQG